MWLSKIKSAYVTENIDEIDRLIEKMPQFNTLDEMQEAFYILTNIKNLMQKNKTDLATQIAHLKSNIEFLQSTQSPLEHKLNLKL